MICVWCCSPEKAKSNIIDRVCDDARFDNVNSFVVSVSFRVRADINNEESDSSTDESVLHDEDVMMTFLRMLQLT